LDQCFRSISVFPEKNDTRFVLHYGQYADTNKIEYFFGDEQDPAQTAKLCIKTIQRCMQTVKKMKEMATRDVEVAAIAAIILWNERKNFKIFFKLVSIIPGWIEELNLLLVLEGGKRFPLF